jgi:hypothetical protein
MALADEAMQVFFEEVAINGHVVGRQLAGC